MSFVYTPVESSFVKVWYVSTTGSDTMGDGSKTNPFASVKKAIESAASGDGIRIFPGTYRLLPTYLSSYQSAGIYDGKGLTIWGTGADTILEFYGADVSTSTSRDAVLLFLNNPSTVITDLTLNYYPNRGTNYSNALFCACRGTIQNCLIENKSSSVNMSASYYNSGPASSPKVYNCILKSNGRYVSDYSGSPLYINCLYDFNPSLGTKQYGVQRTITSNDDSLSSLPNDLKNMGSPSMLNPDGSRSHIGVCGGTNAWGYSQVSLLQNLTHTIYFHLETLKASYPSLTVDYGLPATVPTGLVVALEQDKDKVDGQYELAGYRKRSRVFVADVYTTAQADRNDITEAIKDLFENKTLPVLDARQQDTGIVMACDGVRVEVDLTQNFKARVKIYVYTLINQV